MLLYVSVIVVTALLVGGGVTWNRIAAHRAEQVSVMWSGSPECTGTRVVDFTSDAWSEPWSGPLIHARRGMRCTITVEVHNHSGGTVHLEEAKLPFMGPGGGAVLKVDMATDPDLWDVQSRLDDIDLIRRLDVPLQQGEKTTFEIPVVFRNRGCSSGPRGGQTYFYGFPTVTVETLLYSFEESAGNDLVFAQRDPADGCALHS